MRFLILVPVQLMTLGLLLSMDSWAQVAKPSSWFIFKRCYRHFTQMDFPYDVSSVREEFAGDSTPGLLAQWKNQLDLGVLSGPEACAALLDTAVLQTDSDPTPGRLKTDSALGRRILSTFSRFFQSWSSRSVFKDNLPDDDHGAMEEVADAHPLSLYFLHALFQPGVEYKAILQAGYSLNRVGALTVSGQVLGGPFGSVSSAWKDSKSNPWQDVTFIEAGALLGVEKILTGHYKFGKTLQAHVFSTEQGGIKVNENSGGGILTHQSYMVLNWDKFYDTRATNANSLQRRFAKTIFEELLCQEQPTLTTADVTPLVRRACSPGEVPGNGCTSVSFWQSESCLRCHYQNDFAAAGFRNFALYRAVSTGNEVLNENLAAMGKWTVSEPALDLGIAGTKHLPDEDSLFYRRPPYGALHFRSYSGELIDETFQGTEELGQMLSGVGLKNSPVPKDFYACGVSRFISFLTGLHVPLTNFGLADPAPSVRDLEYRTMLNQFTDELYEKQSLLEVVKSILRSPFYSTYSFQE